MIPENLVEKPTPTPVAGQRKISRLDLFHAISSNFGSAGRKVPPPTKRDMFSTRSTTRNERPLAGDSIPLVN